MHPSIVCLHVRESLFQDESEQVATMAEAAACSSEEANRQTIVSALRAGQTPAEIIRLHNIPKSTVYDIAKQYAGSVEAELGSHTDKTETALKEPDCEDSRTCAGCGKPD